MKDILQKLEMLRNYYEVTRNVGHTTLMKMGTDNYDRPKLVLTITKNHGLDLGLKSEETVGWNNLKGLIGHKEPLAIDDGTMWVILNDLIPYIEELEQDRYKLHLIKNIVK